MESLESRMERLTTEQRREVEDFVDFLLLKNNFRESTSPATSPSPILKSAPPILSADPVTAVPAPLRMQDLVIHEEPRIPAISPEPAPTVVHEIADTHEDGYMDYGMFEQVATPATEAVRNVKRKIIAREAEDKSGHLLDWVD
jgi:hypothetical protein